MITYVLPNGGATDIVFVTLFCIAVGTAVVWCGGRCTMPDKHCLNILLFWQRSMAALVFQVGTCMKVSLLSPFSASLIGLLASMDIKQQSLTMLLISICLLHLMLWCVFTDTQLRWRRIVSRSWRPRQRLTVMLNATLGKSYVQVTWKCVHVHACPSARACTFCWRQVCPFNYWLIVILNAAQGKSSPSYLTMWVHVCVCTSVSLCVCVNTSACVCVSF